MKPTLFILTRDSHGIAQVWYEPHDERGKLGTFRLPIQPSLELRNHSPTGFEWGYGGSGPAQLALAILLKVTGDSELAQAHYQTFKFEFVAGIPKNGFAFSDKIVMDFVKKYEENQTHYE